MSHTCCIAAVRVGSGSSHDFTKLYAWRGSSGGYEGMTKRVVVEDGRSSSSARKSERHSPTRVLGLIPVDIGTWTWSASRHLNGLGIYSTTRGDAFETTSCADRQGLPVRALMQRQHTIRPDSLRGSRCVQ